MMGFIDEVDGSAVVRLCISCFIFRPFSNHLARILSTREIWQAEMDFLSGNPGF